MKKILYIGNKLSTHGATVTSIETLGALLEHEGYELYYASTKKNIILRFLDMFFTTLSCRNKVDYVLIDVYSTLNFWYAFFISQLCRFLRLPYVAKLHGGNLPQRLSNNPMLCNLIFNNAYAITAPSNYLFDAFVNFGFKNVKHVPNTIQIDDYHFKPDRVLEPKLLWVRSFSKIYNPKMAIKVASLLKDSYPNVTLCMVGPDKESLLLECQKYADELNVSTIFTGKLSKKEWIELSKMYSFFLNTAHFDNTPVSVIEAMAVGLPVITTNVGGIPYLITHQEEGILIADGDANGMVDGITTLLKDVQLRDLIVSNARKKVLQYDWELIKYSWFEILN